ncbi:hydrolase [Leptolyngbya sp. 'hensonii']|uniref:HAD-IA family hydrolase n=1 Tax=Leptolyngbya sp. 'hensonii' TaxID=1922337 RepID=UPI00094FE7D4|nr:HAD-IA family hydrolase [Leptolyngbya sp. 'hensonii']OLP19505.1 hydrolase [Leptolyngbya sp. 'hensonii']
MGRPQVIFLDAVGTLFGIRGTVGGIYSRIAASFGVTLSPAVLDQSFRRSFQAAGLPAFPGVASHEIPTQEFLWWQAIAYQTFEQADALAQFSDFEAFFKELFAHFATADPWIVYPDVIPALHFWRSQGIELGILSNFDSRLYVVLEHLNLAQFFTSVTISTQVGAAKPSPEIFTIALGQHQCPVEAAWHIGDSRSEDYEGALKAGLQGFWLRRTSSPIPDRAISIDPEFPEIPPPASIRALTDITFA